ncbi:MAG: serine hydrolase, partial [Bacteroidota bacterium]
MKKVLFILYLVLPAILFSQPSDITPEIRERMASVISHTGKQPVDNFMLYLRHGSEEVTLHEAVGTLDYKGDSISPNYQYNVASITKTMVATVILQLKEEGKLALSDPIGNYLSAISYLRFEDLHNFEGNAYAKDITIYHLLRHQSGLGDIFLDTQTRFNISVLFHKKRMYSPKRIMDTFFKYKLHQKTHFKPGEGSYYTDINFLLLGLIIEQVTGGSLPQQIRERILEPLEMEYTYFEYYEPTVPSEGRITAFLNRIQITHKINTSYEWGGGGIVSTVADMGRFI